jgi:dienelactone hydrolase
MKVPPSALDGRSPADMMYAYLQDKADEALDKRRAAYEALKTPEDVRAYQRRVRRTFMGLLGDMPRRCDLAARTVGHIRRADCAVEKIVFQSHPRHYVTALLYLPRGKGPHPAVLVAPGHTDNGKTGYQKHCLLLARHGLAAFCIDPIGQGERHQLLAPDDAYLSPPTWEHSAVWPSSLLVGRSVATYMVWDSMRAVDYLCARADIDSARIGCTGNSGGGMMTAYLMAAEKRLACAAPSCYVTSYRRLLETIGPQDSEQNVTGLLGAGLDHADYLVAFAPRPALVCCATRDFFDIDGTWDAFRQAKRVYTRLGHAGRVDIAETDWTHGFTENLRVGMVRWMRRWLLGADDEVTESPAKLIPAGRLLCTPRGETLRLAGAKSVMDVNREMARRLARARRKKWSPPGKASALAEVRGLTGIRGAADLPAPRVETVKRSKARGCTVEQLLVHVEPGIVLPAERHRPRGRATGGCLLVSDAASSGRSAKEAQELARAGKDVLVCGPRGLGATRRRTERYNLGRFLGIDWPEATIALLLARPLLVQRAEDVLVLAKLLAGKARGGPARVDLVAAGLAGPPALHAACLEQGLFRSVELRGALANWASVIEEEFTADQLTNVVPGALKVYDLDDLASTLGEKLLVTCPLDATGAPAGAGEGKPRVGQTLRQDVVSWTPRDRLVRPGGDG